jgi:anthranilate phosphoribosyltransferase
MSVAENMQFFCDILDGKLDAGTVTLFLTELAARGETADDIVAAVLAMRERMIAAKAPEGAIDVCGTGGDGQHSLNISTTVALVVAALDVPVAKHGNRAASSKAGTADTLEALGLDLQKAVTGAERTLSEIGIGFFFAQKYHPALGPLAPIRKAIGSRTIFNLLGPLCHPAGVKYQLVGVPTPDLVEIYAQAASQLDYKKMMVVCGDEGLDEISIAGPTRIALVENGTITLSVIRPEVVGVKCQPLSAIKGGDAAFNAAALLRLLDGEKSAYRDAVLLNSAAALIVAGATHSWEDGVEEAAEIIDKGLAKALLNCWIANQ